MSKLEKGELHGEVAIMAAIGHVCLQWSRLEMAFLGVICAVDTTPMAKAELIYGGLDILPRVNMAIKLAEHNKVAPFLVKRLRAARKELQDDLCDLRNQIVHGAHRDIKGNQTTLTMVRWRGDKREKQFTAKQINDIAIRIFNLGCDVCSIFDDYGEWKFGPDGQKNLAHTLAN